MGAALSHGIAGAGRFLRKEFVEAWPVFLFFLVGFVLLITLVKLALAQFSIEITVVSNAVVGAAIAAKAALVLNETPLSRSLEHYRRIVAVTVKTLLYGIACLMLGYVERFFEAYHKVHGFEAATRELIRNANHCRLLAWALGVSIVFSLYFSVSEISQRMGEGALRSLFFDRPAALSRKTNAARG